MTARQLLHSLTAAGCNPSVDANELLLDSDPPSHLERYLPLLQTGVRAVLTGRVWHGLDGDTGRVFDLTPDVRLPRNVGLLSVVGAGECWDRFPSFVLLDFPDLFETEKPVTTRTPRPQMAAPLEGIAS